MQNLWVNLIPKIYSTDSANVSKKATEAIDAEFEAFCAEQKKIRAEIKAEQAEAKPQSITKDIGNIPSEEAVEEVDKASDIPQETLDADKVSEEATTKESKKRKSKKVTAEAASDETLAF